jgi:ubiquinone biosynthesis protein
VEQVLAAELGGSPDEVFARFDRQPLAAASVAQVHAARLRSGAEVVVKVQRPGIRSVVERDLDIVARLASRLESGTRWARSIGTRDLANGFAAAVREELDFRIEAGNMAAVAAAGHGVDGTVRVPVPHAPLCTERVLVMQRLDGTPLTAAGPVIAERGLDRDALARTLLECVLRQIMLDGVFHADPHPGNVLVLTDGRLGLLDFGSVGRLDASVRAALQRLLLAMNRGDPLAASDALLELMLRPDEIDQQRLERALGQFMARYLGPGAAPGVRMFSDLFRIVAEYGLSVPPEVAAVFRALATLEGALARLAPGFDLVAEARSSAGRYTAERLEPASTRQAVDEELTTLLPMLRRLPRRLERIASAAEHGRLSVHVRLWADDRDRRHVTGMLHQVLLTILAATAGIMAVLLLGTGGGPTVTATVSLYQLLGYNLLVVCAILALRVLVLIFRPDR